MTHASLILWILNCTLQLQHRGCEFRVGHLPKKRQGVTWNLGMGYVRGWEGHAGNTDGQESVCLVLQQKMKYCVVSNINLNQTTFYTKSQRASILLDAIFDTFQNKLSIWFKLSPAWETSPFSSCAGVRIASETTSECSLMMLLSHTERGHDARQNR